MKAAQAAAGPADELAREEAGLLACVHCGFCLNACPTYTRLGHEGDSPRGRLDLMRAVVEGRLEADDPAFRTHIDRCLGCRACEPVCPSGVPYGFLLERARHAIAETTGVSWSTRLLIQGFTGPLRGVTGVASRVMRATGLPTLLARHLPAALPNIRFAMAMLASSRASDLLRQKAPHSRAAPRDPAVSANAAPQMEPRGDVAIENTSGADREHADPHAHMGAYPYATGAEPPIRPRMEAGEAVGVLTGCVQEALFARVNRATERVLEHHGCEVRAVPGQVCCGALDAHAGRLDRARELARRNIAAFDAAGAETIVVNAAGCGAMMKEYAEQLKDDPAWSARAHAFSRRVRDAAEFLVARGLRRGAPVPLRVTFDAPCHLHHGQRIREAPLRLLDSVPGLERIPLQDAEECCGGAGLYGVHHPELGGRILADKVAAVRETGAAAVITPNPGCMMQIGAGLILDGSRVAALHPLEILDESYRRARSG